MKHNVFQQVLRFFLSHNVEMLTMDFAFQFTTRLLRRHVCKNKYMHSMYGLMCVCCMCLCVATSAPMSCILFTTNKKMCYTRKQMSYCTIFSRLPTYHCQGWTWLVHLVAKRDLLGLRPSLDHTITQASHSKNFGSRETSS